MADEDNGEYEYICAIPGVSEDRGEQFTVLFTADGFWRPDQLSLHAGLWRQPPATGVPAAVEAALLEVSTSPPCSGPRRVPRALGHCYRPGYASLLCQLRECPLPKLHPELCASLKGVITYAFPYSDVQAVRTLTTSSLERLQQWGLTTGSPGACVVLRYAECRANKWHAASRAGATASPPAHVQRVMLRGCTEGYSELWPTLAASPACMPVLLPPPTPVPDWPVRSPIYAPFVVTAAVMGYSPADPLIQSLCTVSHEHAHHFLCNGGASHTWTALFATLQDASPLKGVRRWGIRSLFSGCETFLCSLRHLGQDHVLLHASEADPRCHVHLRAAYPDVPISADARQLDATLSPDLTILGFPCPPFSDLNLHVTTADLDQAFSDWEAAFQHVLHERPAVVIMENLPTLATHKFDAVFERIDTVLFASPYVWMLDVLCPSIHGAHITRPRLIWVGFLRA